jgi:hypothetical protein
MVFTSGSAKHWLEKEQGQCLPAVLRDNRK